MRSACTCGPAEKHVNGREAQKKCVECQTLEALSVRLSSYGQAVQSLASPPPVSVILQRARDRSRERSLLRVRRSLAGFKLAALAVCLLIVWRLAIVSLELSPSTSSEPLGTIPHALFAICFTAIVAVGSGVLLLVAFMRQSWDVKIPHYPAV